MADQAIGFVYGVVIDIDDPKGIGRVRCRIPGMFPDGHPEWCRPAGWPGAGGLSKGSRYPNSLNAQVLILFELGDMLAPPAFLPLLYGLEDNAPAGPTAVTGVEDPNTVTAVWEDDLIAVYITNDPDAADRRIVLRDKRTGSNITLDAADGSEGNSSSITIEGNTAVYIRSNGLVDIDAPVVQVQGRRVMLGDRTRPGNKGL